MTSQDEKTVHQQSITVDQAVALWRETTAGVCKCNDCVAARVLLREIDRLREKYDLEQKTAFVLAQKLTAMGDELAAFEKVYETHTNQLRAKLASVEALPAQWRKDWDGECGEVATQCAVDLETALNPILKD